MGSFYTDWVDEKHLHSISFSILEYLEMKKKIGKLKTLSWKWGKSFFILTLHGIWKTLSYFCGNKKRNVFGKPPENSRAWMIFNKWNICKNIQVIF